MTAPEPDWATICAHRLMSVAVGDNGMWLTAREATNIACWIESVCGTDFVEDGIPPYAVAMALANETHLLSSGRELSWAETWRITHLVHPGCDPAGPIPDEPNTVTMPPNTIRDGETFRVEARGELSAEYIELVRRSPDEALWHVVAQAAQAEAKLKRIHRLVEAWRERVAASDAARETVVRKHDDRRLRPDEAALVALYVDLAYQAMVTQLRSILDGE